MSLEVLPRTRTRLRVRIGFSPAAPELHTAENTLAGSSLPSNQVVGFAPLANARDSRRSAIRTRIIELEAAQ